MALAILTADVAKHQELAKEYLPKLIANDPLLTLLNLNATYCNDVALSALCDALRANTTLISLSLRSNGIGDCGAGFLSEVLLVNSTIRTLALAVNDIGDEGAAHLCTSMEQNNTLTALDVEGNPQMCRSSVEELSVLTRLNCHPPQLKQTILAIRRGTVGDTIDLSRTVEAMNEFRGTSHDEKKHLDDWCANVLASTLIGNTTVTCIDLAHQHIGDDGARCLAEMVKTSRSLDRIILVGNNITNVGAMHFVDALADCSSLRFIDMQHNALTDSAFVELECALALNRQPLTLKHYYPLLKRNDPTIAHIELDDHASQRYYDDITTRLLFDVLVRNTCLISLAITNGKITAVGGRFIGDLLLRNRALRSLNLSHNTLGVGAKAIADALLSNNVLQSLQLVNTDIGDEEASAFAKMLSQNSSLLELDLSSNPRISSSGDEFARSFNMNTTLNKLDLAGTSISEKTRKEIEHRRLIGQQPERLRKILPLLYAQAENLREVDLTGGDNLAPLRDSSCAIIATPLASNYVVTKLVLANNRIGYDGVVSLAVALLDNRVTLRTLDLSDNPINHGFEFGQLLAQLIRTHHKLESLSIANTGFDTEGCEQIVAELESEKINIVKQIDLSRNPAIDQKVSFKAMVFMRCNSLRPTLKERLLKFYRRWEDDVRCASTAERDADFQGYDGTSAKYRNKDDPPIDQSVFDGAAEVVSEVMLRVTRCKRFLFGNNNLSDRGIEAIAKVIAKDTGLTSFDISGNNITDRGAEALLTAVRSSYHVREVILGRCPQVSPQLLELIRISLSYNAQSKDVKDLLVEVSRNSPQLASIDFCNQLHNHLNDDHITLLCNALERNSFVVSIDVSNNHITNKGLRELVQLLKKSSSITKVAIKNTLIFGPEVAEILLDLCMSKTTALQTLDISYSELTDAAFPTLMQCIETNRNISILGLHKCDLSADLADQLSNTLSLNEASEIRLLVLRLRDPSCSLSSVVVSDRDLSDPQAAELFTALTKNTSVTEVDISGNALSEYTGAAIAACLARNKSITAINFSRNCPGSAMMEPLASALAQNSTLEVLDMSSCGIEWSWIKPLESLLEYNETLHTLNLADNKFSTADDEVLMFIEGVCLNAQPTIKHALPLIAANSEELAVLDASCDVKKNDTGAERIGALLIENSHLVTLCLAHGFISDVGARALCRGLMVNRSVSIIDVSHNRIGDSGAFAFASVLQVNPVLQKLGLSGNSAMTQNGCRVLHAALQQNTCLVDIRIDGVDGGDGAALRDALLFEAELNSWHPKIKEVLYLGEEKMFPELDLSNAAAQGKIVDDRAMSVLSDHLKGDNFVQTLNVSKNKLSFTSGYSIAELLHHNRRLTSIDLSENNILDGSMTIVDAMRKNSFVTALNLAHNGCSPLSIEKLDLLLALNREPAAMKPQILKVLEKDATHSKVVINVPRADHVPNRKPQLDDGSVAIITKLLHTDLIVNELDLCWNNIRDEGLRSIAELLRANPLISTLRLGHNFISDTGVEMLCQIAKKSQELTFVDLSSNMISGSVVALIVDTLHVNPIIHTFKTNDNKLSSDEQDAVDLMGRINKHSSGQLRTVLLSVYDNDQNLHHGDFSSLVSMGLWSHQTSLSLIASALPSHKCLQSLSLEFNDIGDSELAPLSAFLETNSSLSSLSLAQNYLCDVTQFCSSLGKNSTLKVLDLRSNRLNIISAKAIAEMIRKTTSIVELDVGNNLWGRSGAVIINAALPVNDSVTTINVAAKDIPEELVEQAKYNATLHYGQIKLHDESDFFEMSSY